MKKIISVMLTLVFVLSAMASLTLVSSAAVQGDWVTSRQGSDYEEDREYAPAAGYYYDPAIGFITVSPDYAENRNPYTQAHTRNAINLKTDNVGNGNSVSLKIAVLDFAYNGYDGTRDEWIAFTINSQPIASPGSIDHGEGACILLRGNGDGVAYMQPFFVDKEGGKNFGVMTDVGMKTIEVPLNELGQEEYTFEIRYEGSGYSFAINGNWYQDDYLSEILERSCKNGAYIGVHMQSGCTGTKAEFAITEWQGEIPVGDDSAEPEEDLLNMVPIGDSSCIPVNEPAVLWDASLRDFEKVNVAGGTPTLNDNNTFNIKADTVSPYIVFNVKPDVSYEAADFPYIAVLTRNCWANNGKIYYCAGGNYSFSEDYSEAWCIEDQSYVNGWSLGMIDFSYYYEDGWTGRINSLRIGFDFSAEDINDPDYNNFDIGFIGAFRSPDEALAYTEKFLNYYIGIDVGTDMEETTEPGYNRPEETVFETEDETIYETEYETEYETDYVFEDTTVPAWSEIGTYPEDLDPDEIFTGVEEIPEIEGELFGDGLLGKLIEVLVSQNVIPGCSSVVAVPILMLVTVFGAALFVKKKD